MSNEFTEVSRVLRLQGVSETAFACHVIADRERAVVREMIPGHAQRHVLLLPSEDEMRAAIAKIVEVKETSSHRQYRVLTNVFAAGVKKLRTRFMIPFLRILLIDPTRIAP